LSLPDLMAKLNIAEVGQDMYRLIEELYPICRSITGNGVRRTLQIIQQHIPLMIHEVPSGTNVFDWTVPKEWNITDAYIKNTQGERVVDFNASNLHVVSYSVPVKKKMSLTALKPHLFTLPEHPEWIPYRTSYYTENWGFCLSHKQLLQLREDEEYEVCIDSSLTDGHLTYGEYYLPGDLRDEVLISCHVCHPSLCNDNLSGVALVTFLAKSLSAVPRRYSYRFLFIPGTIGSITWLCRNEAQVAHIKHGFVVAGVGDKGDLTYKKSRRGDAEIDTAVCHVLKHSGNRHAVIDFFPYGYDERQFCSPAFNLPIGCVMRTPFGQYPEYHTSADDLDFVQPSSLGDSLSQCLSILSVLEHNKTYVSQNPTCEPQLGRRGIYRAIGGQTGEKSNELALLWVLNMSDGSASLLDIAERAGMQFATIHHAAKVLVEHDLLKEHCPTEPTSSRES
jgi:aminopeptidase-like protein